MTDTRKELKYRLIILAGQYIGRSLLYVLTYKGNLTLQCECLVHNRIAVINMADITL